jgi:hypothetical protein
MGCRADDDDDDDDDIPQKLLNVLVFITTF